VHSRRSPSIGNSSIDGADEVERGTLNLIKGLGGALLYEKIVAAASHRLAIIVDGSKLVDRLGASEVRLVYLRGGRDLIAMHLAGRTTHFIAASLTQSQIDTHEEPDPDEDPLTVDVGAPAGQISDDIIRLLGTSAGIERTTPA
jgi:hypothetical protein